MRGRALTAEERCEREQEKTLRNWAAELPTSGMMSWAQVHPEKDRGEDYDRLSDLHNEDKTGSTARERGELWPDGNASRKQRSAMWTHGLLCEGDTRFLVRHPDLEAYRWAAPVAPNKAFWVKPTFTELPCAPKSISAPTIRSVRASGTEEFEGGISSIEEAQRAQLLKVCRGRPNREIKAHLFRRWPRKQDTQAPKKLSARRALSQASRALYSPWLTEGLTPSTSLDKWNGLPVLDCLPCAVDVALERLWADEDNGVKAKGAEFGVLKIVTEHATDEQRAWWAEIDTPAWIQRRAALSTREILDFENDIGRAPEGRATPNLPKYFPRDPEYFVRRWLLCSWINGQTGPRKYVRYWRCGWLGNYQIEATIVDSAGEDRYQSVYNMDDEAIVIMVRTVKSKATAHRLIAKYGRTFEEVYVGLFRKRLQRKEIEAGKEK